MRQSTFLLVGILFLLSSGCTGLPLKEPKADLKSVYVKDVSLTGANLMFVLDVHNPNTTDIAVDEVAYETFLDGAFFGKAKTEKALTIAPTATTQVELPLPVEFSKLVGGIGKALAGQPVIYRIKGTAKISVFSIPFDKSGQFDINRR